jgi:glutathione S-transferase
VTPVLYQLRLSHFNEKARWALDHKRVPHVRRDALPGFHTVTAMRLKRQQTMPILELDGQRIGESAEIIEALEDRGPGPSLRPADPAELREARELERDLDEHFGPDVRRIFIYHMFSEAPEALRDVWTIPASATARGVYNAGFGFTKFAAGQSLRLKPDAVKRSKERVGATLDRIEAKLGEGDYLAGDSFSLADLTLAALLFPIVQPPEFQYTYPAAPPGLESYRDELRSRRAFGWVEEMWRRHRPESAEVEG